MSQAISSVGSDVQYKLETRLANLAILGHNVKTRKYL